MSTPYSQSFLKERQMMTFIPLLGIPFLTLIFYILGGGQMPVSAQEISTRADAFNANIPEAKLKKQAGSKLSIYQDADQHSSSRIDTAAELPIIAPSPAETAGIRSISHNRRMGTNENLDLNRIQKRIPLRESAQAAPLARHSGFDPDLVRAQTEIHHVYQNQRRANLELKRSQEQEEKEVLEQRLLLMEKRLALMNANRAMDQVLEPQKPENSGNSAGAHSTDEAPNPPASRVVRSVVRQPSSRNNFYGIGTGQRAHPVKREGATIEAVIHEKVTIVSGSTIKLRLLNDLKVNGAIIPQNSFVFGVATIDGERVQIGVQSVRYEDEIFPVKLNAYDLDGQPGLYLPGGIERQATKQMADKTITSAPTNQLFVANGSNAGQQVAATIAGQVATTTLDGVKNLAGKKVRLVKATLKANYKVLLK